MSNRIDLVAHIDAVTNVSIFPDFFPAFNDNRNHLRCHINRDPPSPGYQRKVKDKLHR